MKKQYKVIELFGLPGSGKTTLMDMMGGNDNNNIFFNKTLGLREKAKIYRTVYKFFVIIYVILISPLASIKQIILIYKTKQKTIGNLIKVLADWFFTLCLLKKAKRNNQTIIFDQGIIQAIWSINLSAKVKLDIEGILKGIPLPDLIIVLDVEESIIRKRLKERPGKQSRLEKEDFFREENIYSWVRPFEIFMDIKQYLIETQTEVVIVNNEAESQLQENLDMFKRKISVLSH